MSKSKYNFILYDFTPVIIENLFPQFILDRMDIISSDMREIFNVSFHQLINSHKVGVLNFTEIFQIFKFYFLVNSKFKTNENDFSNGRSLNNDNNNYNACTTPIIYFNTIIQCISIITKYFDPNLFNNSQNLKSLEDFLEFIPIINNNIELQNELANFRQDHMELSEISNCLNVIRELIIKLKNLNEKFNNINKEKVAYYINFFSLDDNRNTNAKVLQKDKNEIYNKKVSDNLNMCDDNKVSIIEKKKIPNNSEMILNCKTKKYTQNHFSKESFKKMYILTMNLSESSIYQAVQQAATENYILKKRNYDNIVEYLDFNNLKNIFNNKFIDHSLYVIGSCRFGLLTDINGKKTTVDLCILPNIYDKKEKGKNIYSFLNKLGSSETIFQKLNNLGNENNSNQLNKFSFKNIQCVDTSNLTFNFDLENKSLPDKNFININLYFYNEKLKHASDTLITLFHKNDTLRTLHFFFQEILISKLKLLVNRRELSFLIVAFLDKIYNLLSVEIKEKRFYYLNGKFNLKSTEEIYFSNVNESSMTTINNSNIGELIIEFFRFFLNYLVYIKNDYNRKINQNFITVKGFDTLSKMFEYDFMNEKFEFYLYNHLFMKRFYDLSKREYDSKFCKTVENLSELYFKICEESEKINGYNNILYNIKNIE